MSKEREITNEAKPNQRRGSVISLKAIQESLTPQEQELCKAHHISLQDAVEFKKVLSIQDAILCKQNGITLRDALIYRAEAMANNCNIEFRGGSPLHDMNEQFGRKPILIKEKSNKSQDFANGFVNVSTDPARNAELYEKGISTDVYRIPLGKILSLKDANGDPLYKIDENKSDFGKGILTFSVKVKLGEPEIYCRINLKDFLNEADKNRSKDTSDWSTNVTDAPDWWKQNKDKLGDFNAAMKFCYKAQRMDEDGNYQHQKVYFTKNAAGNLVPISTDNDLMAISCPREMLLKMKGGDVDLVTKRIDCSDRAGATEFLNARASLQKWREGQKSQEKGEFIQEEKIPEIKKRSSILKQRNSIVSLERPFDGQMGYTTAYESERVGRINTLSLAVDKGQVQKSDMLFRPIPHAAESGNLDYTSGIDKTIIFMPNGQILKLNNEAELVASRISQLSQQFYLVNENCNMKAWAPYVAAQINYRDSDGQAWPVTDSLKIALLKYVNNTKDPISDDVKQACQAIHTELSSRPIPEGAELLAHRELSKGPGVQKNVEKILNQTKDKLGLDEVGLNTESSHRPGHH